MFLCLPTTHAGSWSILRVFKLAGLSSLSKAAVSTSGHDSLSGAPWSRARSITSALFNNPLQCRASLHFSHHGQYNVLFVHPWHTVINKRALWLPQYPFSSLKAKWLNISNTSLMVGKLCLTVTSHFPQRENMVIKSKSHSGKKQST